MWVEGTMVEHRVYSYFMYVVRVWATPRCIRAIQTGVNFLTPLHAWPNRASYEFRLAKYATRGYTVAIACLDKSRIDHGRIRATVFRELKGLSRVMKITFAMEKGIQYGFPVEVFDPAI